MGQNSSLFSDRFDRRFLIFDSIVVLQFNRRLSIFDPFDSIVDLRLSIFDLGFGRRFLH